MNFYSDWQTANQLMMLSQKTREIVIEGQLVFSSACLHVPTCNDTHMIRTIPSVSYLYTNTHTHTVREYLLRKILFLVRKINTHF